MPSVRHNFVVLKSIGKGVGADMQFRCDSFQKPSMVRRRFQQPRPKVSTNFDGTTDHAVEERAESDLRALRALRGDPFFSPRSINA
jgi:hypothetical protein